jgi:hypothetical protein
VLRNAEDLINGYWEREKQKKKLVTKSQSASAPVKRGRKSEIITIEGDDEKPAKKRVKKSQGASEDEDEGRRKSIGKKSSEKNASKAPVVPDEDVEDIDEASILDITGNNKYMKMTNWEEIVQRIETVEFDKQLGYLVVYMLLK